MLVPVSGRPLPSELDVLRDVSGRLGGAGIAFMLTGSLAMNFYAIPRLTRDIDLVIALQSQDVERVVTLFTPDYYVSREAVDEAIRDATAFNLIHKESVIKVDCIPQKRDPFHVAEFERRRQVTLGDFTTWLTTREDLVIAKLLWARSSRSEVQLTDVRNLAGEALDKPYVDEWVDRLGLKTLWDEVRA